MNPNPTWSFKPGVIFRMTSDEVVVDEDNMTRVLREGTLLMTLGWGSFVVMETGDVFRVDELDARIMELDAELLSE